MQLMFKGLPISGSRHAATTEFSPQNGLTANNVEGAILQVLAMIGGGVVDSTIKKIKVETNPTTNNLALSVKYQTTNGLATKYLDFTN